jgi:mRNA interferase MazF
VLRSDVYGFRPPRGTGHEQQRRRCGVIVQANEMLSRSVVLVAPTSLSAKAASFRPRIDLLGAATGARRLRALGGRDRRTGLRSEKVCSFL